MLFFVFFFQYSTSIREFDLQTKFMDDFNIPLFFQVNSSSILIENQTLFQYFPYEFDITLSDYQKNLNQSDNFDWIFLIYVLSFKNLDLSTNYQKSIKYLSKAAEMGHPFAKILELINNENDFYNTININLPNNDKQSVQFLYDRFYIFNKLFYNCYLQNESLIELNMSKILGITNKNMHYIPSIRNNSKCYQIYSLFRLHQYDDAISMILSSDLTSCDSVLQDATSHIDDPFIIYYYILKYDRILAYEFLRNSLQYHGLIRPLITYAYLMEEKGKYASSLEMHKILANFGIERSVDDIFRISNLYNLTVSPQYHTMKMLNEKIKIKNAIHYINQSYSYPENLAMSFSYLHHAETIVPKAILVTFPLKIGIIITNLALSLLYENESYNVIDIIRENADIIYATLMLVIVGIIIQFRIDVVQ